MEIPFETILAFEEVRKSGKYNMFDAYSVVSELEELGYYDAVLFITGDRGKIDTEKYVMVMNALGKYNENKNTH